MSWRDQVVKPEAYLEAFERLARRATQVHARYEFSHPGLTLGALESRAKTYCKRLARIVREGTYLPGVARVRRILLDKERELYSFCFDDLMVHHVFSSSLTSELTPRLSSSLYSYQAGRSNLDALQALAQFIRRHKASRPNPRERGLYLFRGDVRRYTETIPVNESSPLWSLIAGHLGSDLKEFSQVGSLDWLVRQLVRPRVRVDGGQEFYPERGVPTGSPISTWIANLYLSDLDHELSRVPGAIYARFGDDLLFAHHEASKVSLAHDRVHAELARLGLELNQRKVKLLYMTGAGRPSPAAGFEGCQQVDFLGYGVDFNAQIKMKTRKIKEWKNDLKLRISNTLRVLGEDLPTQGRLRILCQVLNQAQDPVLPGSVPHADSLRRVVSDRSQLKELDRWLALQVAQSLTRRSGARAFRLMSYQQVRESGLESIVYRRRRSALKRTQR